MKIPQSPFAWPGGKRALKNTLLGLIPEHRIYVEVFAGSAKLLFAKPASEREIMNDLNGEVVNFFRVAKHRPAALAEMFDHEIVHAGRFRELLASPEQPDELQRALRFVYLAWYSYGSKGEHFAGSSAKGCQGNKLRRSLDRVRDLLDQTAARLRNVLIEQRDFAEILTRYDSAESFLYLDPPYVHFQPNGRYDALSEERRMELFELLAGLKGKFLMSFDDCSEVRQLARKHGLKTMKVAVGYSLGSSQEARSRKAAELLLANYTLPK
ncbi:DNA adenine methylase [Granulicella sp. WH15]|uniref:DNA adenine methylase n=1 Tax=Granulicella sp. WH15 TaxID=2602070 RepID=UPI0013674EFE|nr:DNA adenine methylase [Granulicella sp. WH15]QHN04405.1 DNA adenine methylase [Granulicella sp. WH15]